MMMFFNISILLVAIFCGYILSRFRILSHKFVVYVLLYCFAPLVIFYGAYKTPLSGGMFLIPVAYIALATSIALSVYTYAQRTFSDQRKNLIGFVAGSGNVGYFSLPFISMLYGDYGVALTVLVIMGIVFYENTVGFFLLAKGKYTTKQSIKKMLLLPAIYAFVLGIVLQFTHTILPDWYGQSMEYVRMIYVFGGMMLVGMGIAQMEGIKIDYPLLYTVLATKYLIWPLCIGVLILLDRYFFHIYGHDEYMIFMMISGSPLAANTVAMAQYLQADVQKAAFIVAVSTGLSLVLTFVFVLL